MLRDILFGFRYLLARKSSSLAIIVVLAVGIGANTAMFSGFEAWVLRPLDFPDPERLVLLQEAQPALGRDRISLSAKNYADWMEQQSSFEAAGLFRRHRFNLADDGEPIRVDGARISATLFPTLGKTPILGRGFDANDDRPGQPADVVLISERLWRERFESDANVLGRSFRLDGRSHTVVGVMEAGFRFPEWAEVWTPLGLDAEATDRADRWLSAVARLRGDATLESAQAELDAIAERLAREYPRSNRDYAAQILSLREAFVPPVIRVALTASLAAAVFVLLVICANVASLLLAQASARTRELAVRTALGASRRRLLRQNLIEGLLLALPAGALGACLGVLGVRSMLAYVPVDPPYLFQMGFNYEAGVYTLFISLLTAATCALAPLVWSSGLHLNEALKAGARSSGGVGSAGRKGRAALILGEVALSTSLVVLAFLMVKSFLALQATNPGFDPEGLIVAELALEGEGLDAPASRAALAERLVDALNELPATESAAAVSRLPATQSNQMWEVQAEGTDSETSDGVLVTVHAVEGRYFETLGVDLLDGRDFTDAELREGADVVIVSEGLARRLWGETNVSGMRLGGYRMTEPRWLRVVGVVRDIDIGRDMVASNLPTIQLYQPFRASPTAELALALRSRRDPATASDVLRQTVHRVAAGVPISEVLTMDDAIFRVRWVSRLFSRQLVIQAALAILIAAVGLYGLTMEGIAGRTKELAIRTALGAGRLELISLVMKEALYLGGAGIAVGLLLTTVMARAASSMLVAVSPDDPAPFALVGGVLFVVLLGAAFQPARLASRQSPIAALRSE